MPFAGSLSCSPMPEGYDDMPQTEDAPEGGTGGSPGEIGTPGTTDDGTGGTTSAYDMTGIPKVGIYYFHKNQIENIYYVTNSYADVEYTVTYRPYGEEESKAGKEVGKFGYTSQENDHDGLFYYGARYYDPEIGRFVQADTIIPDPVNSQCYNRYMYCLGNPIIYNDPTGHSSESGGEGGDNSGGDTGTGSGDSGAGKGEDSAVTESTDEDESKTRTITKSVTYTYHNVSRTKMETFEVNEPEANTKAKPDSKSAKGNPSGGQNAKRVKGTLPTSGGERPYTPETWNDGGEIQSSTNCYAYALNLYKYPNGSSFPKYNDFSTSSFALQPGDLSNNILRDDLSNIEECVKADAKTVGLTFRRIGKYEKPKKGKWKIALAVNPWKAKGYHWYRQNPDGTWSYKDGPTPVQNCDNFGKIIKILPWNNPEEMKAIAPYVIIRYYEIGY